MAQLSEQIGAVPPQAIHHELRSAENSAAYLLPKLQKMRESNTELAILDVGAGSGTISATLAKLVPDGKVTATDLNKDILQRAQAVAGAAGVTNIEFKEADAYKLPFADGSFDITHCHQVLAHLEAPWEVLREMLRVTKVGGVVAAREGDQKTECFWPELPGLVKFHDFITEFMTLAGGSPIAGRQLLPWALKAGVERGKVTASYGTWHYSEPDEKRIWADALIERCNSGRVRTAGIQARLVTESDLDEMGKAWKEWSERDDASLGMMQGEILLQK
ncbi:MAG: hypothetical protein M1820_004138 [Bogoriella megaspora]|nr:MAG: hypothetical protein M1820_004138 [Bogoriella megaspora]